MKKGLLYVFIFFAAFSYSQVTTSTVSPSTGTNCQCTTRSWSQMVDNAYTDGIMFIHITCAKNSNTVSAVKYAGFDFTLLTSQSINGNGIEFVYYLLAPPGGTGTASVTVGTSDDIAVASMVYYGVDQTTPFEGGAGAAIKSQGSSSTARANTINTATAGDYAVQFVGALKQINSVGAGQTWQAYQNNNSAIYETITDKARSAATMTLTTSLSGGGGDWGSIGIGLKPGNALPIQLLNFNAVANKKQVDVNWASATETNNKFYSVERSTNGIDFTEIGRVNSKTPNGNSLLKLDYQFTDVKPLSGTSYYRLRQTDYNGKTESFNIVTVNFEPQRNITFTVYPNPGEGQFTVDFTGIENNHEIEVSLTDLQGKQVYKNTVTTDASSNSFHIIPSEKIANGPYLCLLTVEGIKYQVKIIVN